MTTPRKIRWMIAHHPVYLFQRTAEAFGAELERLLPGRFELEVHTPDTYVKQYDKLHKFAYARETHPLERAFDVPEDKIVNHPSERWAALWDGLRDGDIEITQAQIFNVGAYLDKDYHVLDLPFLFKSHDHVSRVLDGEIGDKMGAKLGETTGITGIAFTYSGGYRIFGSNSEITNLTDLLDSKVYVGSAASHNLFDRLGHKNYTSMSDDDGKASADTTSAIETTYLRFAGKHVFKTNHSMFLTTILTGNKFWDSLTIEEQLVFRQIVKTVAKLEREWSVNDAKTYEDTAEAKGIKIIPISQEDTEKLTRAAQYSYAYLKNQYSVDPDLITSIIQQGK